jgi:hypothetical protein
VTKASDNVYPRFLISEGGSTSTPASGRVTVYAKADGLLYSKDDAGAESLMSQKFKGCKAVANANTTLTTSGTEYPIAFAAADAFDTDAFHDPSSSNTRMTIPAGLTGYYSIRGQAYVATTTATYIDLKIRKGGAAGTVLSQARNKADDGNTLIQVSVACINLSAAEYVELYIIANENSRAADSAASMFEIAYLGA